MVDQSSSSKRAVEYVATVLATRRGFQLCLAHFLSQLPPEMLEFGGAEDPEREQQLDSNREKGGSTVPELGVRQAA